MSSSISLTSSHVTVSREWSGGIHRLRDSQAVVSYGSEVQEDHAEKLLSLSPRHRQVSGAHAQVRPRHTKTPSLLNLTGIPI